MSTTTFNPPIGVLPQGPVPVKVGGKSYEDRLNASPRCRLLVTSRTHNLVLPDGHLIPANTPTSINIGEIDLPAVEALVETEPELIDQAEKFAQKQRDKVIATMMGEGWTREQAEDSVRIGISKEAAFFHLNNRCIKPLIGCEVLERGIPSNATVAAVEKKEAQSQNFSELARVLSEANNETLLAMAELLSRKDKASR